MKLSLFFICIAHLIKNQKALSLLKLELLLSHPTLNKCRCCIECLEKCTVIHMQRELKLGMVD